MFGFSFDIIIYAIHALPPIKRLAKYILFFKGAAYALYWRYTNFSKYLNCLPSDFAPWSGAVTYGFYNEVGFNRAVYISLSDGNTANSPDSNPALWLKVLDNWIGINHRLRFNGKYINLTYALNLYFNTTFRQPPYPAPYDYGLGGGTFSDIYITNTVPLYLSLVGFPTLRAEDTMYPIGGSYFGFPTLITGAASSFEYTIHIPTAIYAALGSAPVAESIVRNFVDQYNIAGIAYSIITY